MTQQAPDNEEDKPLDPAVEKVRKKLVRFVGINLSLLFFAVMAVVGAVVYKSGAFETAGVSGGDIPSPDGTVEADIALPAGATIMSQSLSGNRVAIDAQLVDGSRAIFVYDLGERRMIGRLAITSP